MCMHETHYMIIHPNKLKVDMTYQRDVNEHKVKKIIDDFKMDLFNPPKVSHRRDGYYYIFDGQHSMVAHKRVFGENAPINCKVFEGLTYSDEVQLFVEQNGHSSEVNTNDKLKALYNDPSSDVKDMVVAADKAGVRIDFKRGDCQNHISATMAAYSVWQTLGKDNFINVIYTIKNAWDGEPRSFDGRILKGLGYVYKKYGELIQNARMISSLQKHTPDWYMREATDMKGSATLRYAKLFVEAYNYKRVTNKLEEFWR